MEHGGKLLMYQSWQEAAIPPGGLVDYFEHVQAAMGDPSKTEDSIRLFVVPGAGMCSGFDVRGLGAWNALDVDREVA